MIRGLVLSILAFCTCVGAQNIATNAPINLFITTPVVIGQSMNTIAQSPTWKPACVLPTCNPGGVNPPIVYTQLFSQGVPSLSDNSMLLSETCNTSNCNVLWTDIIGYCDSCAVFKSDFWVYLGSNSAKASSFEYDSFNFDKAENLDFMFGIQCNQVSGFWQYSNQSSPWYSSSIPCALSYNSWHHIQILNYRVIGDTSCTGGVPCERFYSLTIDNNIHEWNEVLPSTVLSSTFNSAVGFQFQIDIGSITGTQTVQENIDEANFTASY